MMIWAQKITTFLGKVILVLSYLKLYCCIERVYHWIEFQEVFFLIHGSSFPDWLQRKHFPISFMRKCAQDIYKGRKNQTENIVLDSDEDQPHGFTVFCFSFFVIWSKFRGLSAMKKKTKTLFFFIQDIRRESLLAIQAVLRIFRSSSHWARMIPVKCCHNKEPFCAVWFSCLRNFKFVLRCPNNWPAKSSHLIQINQHMQIHNQVCIFSDLSFLLFPVLFRFLCFMFVTWSWSSPGSCGAWLSGRIQWSSHNDFRTALWRRASIVARSENNVVLWAWLRVNRSNGKVRSLAYHSTKPTIVAAWRSPVNVIEQGSWWAW